MPLTRAGAEVAIALVTAGLVAWALVDAGGRGAFFFFNEEAICSFSLCRRDPFDRNESRAFFLFRYLVPCSTTLFCFPTMPRIENETLEAAHLID